MNLCKWNRFRQTKKAGSLIWSSAWICTYVEETLHIVVIEPLVTSLSSCIWMPSLTYSTWITYLNYFHWNSSGSKAESKEMQLWICFVSKVPIYFVFSFLILLTTTLSWTLMRKFATSVSVVDLFHPFNSAVIRNADRSVWLFHNVKLPFKCKVHNSFIYWSFIHN